MFKTKDGKYEIAFALWIIFVIVDKFIFKDLGIALILVLLAYTDYVAENWVEIKKRDFLSKCIIVSSVVLATIVIVVPISLEMFNMLK